jgi:trimeric autotransporter adhesin
MSTKTNFKRIALVAVTALGAGFLSVAPANAANEPAVGDFILVTRASTTGSGIVATAGDMDGARSTGWITKGTASSATTGTTSVVGANTVGFMMNAAGGSDAVTGVIYAGAQLAFGARTLNTVSAEGMGFVVSGATISGLVVAQGTSLITGSGTTAIAAQNGTTAANYIGGLITVNGAVGSTVTISVYQGAGITTTATATNGVLVGTVSLTVASASASGTYSAADSSIYVQPGVAVGDTSATIQAYDTASNLNNGQLGVIWVQTKDAYSTAVTGQLTASASAGNVAVTNSTVVAADSYSGSTTFGTQAVFDGDGYITVRQPTANTASTSVVTITLNGAVIATKTIKWNGIAASVSLVAASSSSIFSNGYISNDTTTVASARNLGIVYSVRDAAGNAINVADAATALSVSDQTGSMVGALLDQTDLTGTPASGDLTAILQTTSLGYGVATMEIPASSLSGAGTYMLKYVNSAGATIKSAAINATVSAGAASFTASWDKASYATGDIATLTITAKDSKGQLVADGVVLGTGALVTTNSDGLASVTSACDSANIPTTTYSAGSKVCKFAVKNAAGSYSYTAIVATSASQAATTGTVKITDASGSVSNADVLKSIVALIASINKQIQALQKLILKR